MEINWKKFKKKNVCLVIHQHADLDALGSAMALQSYLMRTYSISSKIYAKSLNSLSKKYVAMHDFKLEKVIDKLNCEVALVIDTASLNQLGFELSSKTIVVFDHHITNDIPSDYKYLKPYSSTARVIYEYVRDVNAYEAQHLLAGLLYDTSFLRYADIEDLDVVKQLLLVSKTTLNDYWFIREQAINIEKEAKKFMVQAIENSFVLSWFGKKIIVSKVGSYESKIAAMFLQLGFDASLIFSLKKKESRLSCRFNDKSFEEAEVKELVGSISKALDMKCGGHKYVIYCKGKTLDMDKIFNILKKALV